jgi:predicted nucleic acid-binding protein
MYETALILHNVLRLVALLLCLLVVVRAFRGWRTKRPWSASDRLYTLLLTIVVDVQLVIGILLHVLWSPVTTNAFKDMGAAMKDASIRKFLVEHPVMMIAGIALVHAGKILAKNATHDAVRHRRLFVYVGIALLLFFFGTSWPWQEVARPWLRTGG